MYNHHTVVDDHHSRTDLKETPASMYIQNFRKLCLWKEVLIIYIYTLLEE